MKDKNFINNNKFIEKDRYNDYDSNLIEENSFKLEKYDEFPQNNNNNLEIDSTRSYNNINKIKLTNNSIMKNNKIDNIQSYNKFNNVN